MIKSELLTLWTEKERQLGRRLTIGEVAEQTGLSRDAISGLLNSKTGRFDSDTIARMCEYFGVREGEQVPFLIVRYQEAQ